MRCPSGETKNPVPVAVVVAGYFGTGSVALGTNGRG